MTWFRKKPTLQVALDEALWSMGWGAVKLPNSSLRPLMLFEEMPETKQAEPTGDIEGILDDWDPPEREPYAVADFILKQKDAGAFVSAEVANGLSGQAGLGSLGVVPK